jgi:hypothetical protein
VHAITLGCACVVACGRVRFDVIPEADGGGDATVTTGDAGPPRGVYLANGGTSAASSWVRFYPPSATTTTAPLRTIAGPTSGLDGPEGLYVDVARGELYVANFFAPYSVRVFALESDGDAAPLRTLDSGTFLEPRRAFVDQAHDEMILTDFSGAVFVYPRLASGQDAPLRKIAGTLTLIDNPLDTALDQVADELYVATNNVDGANHGGVVVFDRTASGNVAPKRVIGGTNGHFNATAGTWMTLDVVNRELYVAAYDGAGVDVFDMTATGNATPKRELVGAATHLANASEMFIDNATDRLDVVLAQPTNEVLVFPRTASGNVAPLLELTPSGADSLWGFAIDGATAFTGP